MNNCVMLCKYYFYDKDIVYNSQLFVYEIILSIIMHWKLILTLLFLSIFALSSAVPINDNYEGKKFYLLQLLNNYD